MKHDAKRLWILLLLACAVLAGCDAVRRVTPPGTAVVVEAAVFEGGYGIGWHQRIAKQYSEEQVEGDVSVNLWGDPRVVEKVKPRILRGNPPDLMLMADLPIWKMIAAGKLVPFDAVLDQPAVGALETWRALFRPGTLDSYTSEGKVYAVPSALGAWVWWYDATLFATHGWRVPQSVEDLLSLCETIKAAGIAPIAYQGKYPMYGWWTLTPLIQRCGGVAAINRINALEADAFSHPDVVRAAGILQRLAQQHFQEGALAMTHTESQLQFVNNKAALIFCGLWLYNEMKAYIGEDFDMRCFSMPAVHDGHGNPGLLSAEGMEFIYVSTEARYPDSALDFARYLVSPLNAPSMGEEIGVISPLIGGTDPARIPGPLRSALEVIDACEGIFAVRLHTLLLEWRVQVMEPALNALLRGEITSEAFGQLLDAGLERARQDESLVIPRSTVYDALALGDRP